LHWRAVEQRDVYERQLALLEALAMWTSEKREGRWVNTTGENIARISKTLEELDRLLAEYDPGSTAEGEKP
jgi:hypothetical protein